jgi:cellulose synthase/poly-beta-1,6-N-acetylglucosamine synthase-like glycosyltransferase
LLALDYPKDKLEIILIDDGSTDETWAIMQKYRELAGVKIFQKANGGKHTALNLGLSHTKTELVGCLDADSFVASDALSKMVCAFEDPTVMAATPAIIIAEPKSIIQKIQSTEYQVSVFLRRMLAALDAINVTPGPFSIFRAKVFIELGPYRKAHNTEDMELALRLQKHHYRIVNVRTAHVYTYGPSTLYRLYRQRQRWVTGFLKNAIDYRELFFKYQYGNLGLFVLPAAVISIFTILAYCCYLLVSFAQVIYSWILRFEAVGWRMPPSPHLDWFYVNTHLIGILAVAMLAIALAGVFTGQWLSHGRVKISSSLFYYLALYGFIAPIWQARSVFNTIFNQKNSWH